MADPDLLPRECSLADLPRGVPARVVSVAPGASAQLTPHGLRSGVVVAVEGDAPFAGPRVIRIGSARVAVARAVAQAVTVRPRRDRSPGARR